MSTYVIDSARTNERLSAFMSEILHSEPIDNYFPRRPIIDALMKNKKMKNGGRQAIFPIDSGFNQTVKDFSDYDVFDTARQDTVLTVGYPMVNKGGTVSISWEELREVAGDDHRIFDIVKNLRKNADNTIMDQLETDLFKATQDAAKVTSLNVAIDSTGTLGGLSASTDADWASTETSSGSFAAQGLSDMRTLFNTIQTNGADPDLIVTTQSVYEFYEKEIDPDVRYAVSQKPGEKWVGRRGFTSLEFNGLPIIYSSKVTSGVLYMITQENLFFCVDSEGNFGFSPFVTPHNQEVSVSKFKFRGQLICDRRKSHGKLTSIVA